MTAAARRTVWITGATSGIGKATVVPPVIQRGDRLVLSARKQAFFGRFGAKRLDATDAVLAPFDLAHTDGLARVGGRVCGQTPAVSMSWCTVVASAKAAASDRNGPRS